MDLSTVALLGVLAVMLANQIVMRQGRREVRPVPFWALQVVDVVTAGLVVTLGLPGFERWPIIKWVIGMLLLAHVIQNLSLKARWAADARRRAREAEEDALYEQQLRDEADVDAKGPPPT